MGKIARVESLADLGEPFAEVAAALGGVEGEFWFVGGALRDHMLGQAVEDVDIAAAGDARGAARALHARFGGDIFSLSDRFGTWRVLPEDSKWQLDLTALRGQTIEEDLACRDFSVNAMAVPALPDGELIDPHGGVRDTSEGILRVLGEASYRDDPLRPLRLVRLAATLGMTADPATAELTKKYAGAVPETSAERIFAELQAVLSAPDPAAAVRLLAEFGLLAAVMPELDELIGVDQSVYHHLDAFDHTLEVLSGCADLVADPAREFGDNAERLREQFERPLGDRLNRGQALRWAALLHDIAKARTRVVSDDGRVGFPAHDKLGAEMAREILGRLKASEALVRYVAAITRCHLRLGFLVHSRPIDPRTTYRYLRECEPVEVEVGVLSLADRMATRGRKSEQAIAAHSELAVEMTESALSWRERPVQPVIRGDQLAAEIGIEPGPQLGELLDALAEEQYIGEVVNPEQAIDFARNVLASRQ